MQNFCAIDFGTSNSAVALPGDHGRSLRLAELEPGFTTMPTAVFYNAEDETRCYGREAVAAYVDGFDGRLMRSIKSILGSDLLETSTEIGHGLQVKYIDVVIAYLRHLKTVAERQTGHALTRVVIGRPVQFVDDDRVRDAKAEAALASAARAAGFREIQFQFEPIAAAFDYESTLPENAADELVMVADIGGGTADFSLVRVGPARRRARERRDDILANHGIHVAGTDFDRAVNLAAIMPQLGLGSVGPQGRRVPSSTYFDLATWHLINTVYAPPRVAGLMQSRSMYGDQVAFERLLRVIDRRLGHQLAATAEAAKIEVSQHGHARLALAEIEADLSVAFDTAAQTAALQDHVAKIVRAANETATLAGVAATDVNALYFTGGSTGLAFLSAQIAAAFPHAKKVAGDRFASVVSGLGIHAAQVFR
jgi:hypothetical chaperone protein